MAKELEREANETSARRFTAFVVKDKCNSSTWMKWQEAEDYCVVGSIIACALHLI
jgi:hypothetical protein